MSQRRSERNKSVEDREEPIMDDLYNLSAKYGSGARVTSEQRDIMLQFMRQHPSLAKNSFSRPDATAVKRRLWAELAEKLNACRSGPTKTAERWGKTWQDWRWDTRQKAAKLRKLSHPGAKDGPALKVTRLTPSEELLLQILEMESEPNEMSPGTSHSNQDSSSYIPDASAHLSLSMEQPEEFLHYPMKTESVESHPHSPPSPHHNSSSNISDSYPPSAHLSPPPHDDPSPSDACDLQSATQANMLNELPSAQKQKSRKRRISTTGNKDHEIEDRLARAAEIRALAEKQKAEALTDIALSVKELTETVGDSLKRTLEELVSYLRRS